MPTTDTLERFIAKVEENAHADAIEQIVKHRQARLRVSRSRGAAMIFDFHPSVFLRQFGAIGQTNQRTVMPEQPMPAPTFELIVLLINRWKHHLLVQFNEGGVLELGAGMRPSSRRDRLDGLPVSRRPRRWPEG